MDRLPLLPPQGGHPNARFGVGFFGRPILCALVPLSLALPGGRGIAGPVATSGAVLYIASPWSSPSRENVP